MALHKGPGIVPNQDRSYMDEIEKSIDDVLIRSRNIPIGVGGSIEVPLWEFKEGVGDPWTITNVEREPYGDEVFLEMEHQNGQEIGEVVFHLSTGTIVSVDTMERLGS